MDTFDYNYVLLYAIILVGWIVFRAVRLIRAGKVDFWREVTVTLFFVYLVVLSYQTFAPFNFYVAGGWRREPNLVPLTSLLRSIRVGMSYQGNSEFEHFYQALVLLNFLGNVAVFIPIGIFLPVLFKRVQTWWGVMLGGLLISLSIETVQTFLPERVFDIDDLILNTTGALVGYWIFRLLGLIRPLRAFFERIGEAGKPKPVRFILLFGIFIVTCAVVILYIGYSAYMEIPR